MRGKALCSAALQCFLFVFPWPVRRLMLKLCLGYKLARTSRIGFSIIHAQDVVLGDYASIGHLSFVWGLERFVLGVHSHIGNLNWVSGFPRGEMTFFRDEPVRASELLLEEHSAITNRHHIDCANSVCIGRYATFAGAHSQILTHSVDFKNCKQSSQPVVIGEYCFVGTGCVLLKGARLANYCILGAGSVLRTADAEEYCLWSGVPAQKIRALAHDWKYFSRIEGYVC